MNKKITHFLKDAKRFDLIKYLLKVQAPLHWQVSGIIAMFLSYSLFTKWIGGDTWTHSFIAGFAFMVSIYFHEYGHLLVFKKNGVRAKVLTIYPLGAVATAINNYFDKKSDKLSWFKQSLLVLMGPLFNLILVFVGSVLVLIPFEPVQFFASSLIYLNVFLAIFNLLPLGRMDAGLFANTLLANTENEDEWKIITVPGLIFSAVILYIFYRASEFSGILFTFSVIVRGGWIIVFGSFLYGFIYKSKQDDAKDEELAHSPQRMNTKETLITCGIYLAMIAALLAFAINAPFFLI